MQGREKPATGAQMRKLAELCFFGRGASKHVTQAPPIEAMRGASRRVLVPLVAVRRGALALLLVPLAPSCRKSEPGPRESSPSPAATPEYASGAERAAQAARGAEEPLAPATAPQARRAAATAQPAVGNEPSATPRPLNVLLLTVDSLRADMPWAGYPRQIAPNLTALAEESAVWENHRSVASYTAQTVATWLSGQYASTLYRDGWFFTSYSPHNRFFTEVLQEQGIATIGLHAHMYFGRDKGLEQGFETWEIVPGISFDARTDKHVTSQKSAERLIALLGEPALGARQFFAWSHFMDPHDQYIAHAESPDFGKKNRDRYDSEVFYTDMWIGKVLAFARSQPWWDHTAVIVTGDHGEAFGEHGMYKHAFDLWDVLVRVPLVIRVPGAAPVRISAPRTHIDLAPTIMDLMRVRPLGQFAGRSLLPEIRGADPDSREPLVLELAEDSHNPGLRAVIHGDYKLIIHTRGGPARLFNLRQDPGELTNLAKTEPAKVRELSGLLEQRYATIPVVEPFGGMKLRSGRRARGPEGPQEPGG